MVYLSKEIPVLKFLPNNNSCQYLVLPTLFHSVWLAYLSSLLEHTVDNINSYLDWFFVFRTLYELPRSSRVEWEKITSGVLVIRNDNILCYFKVLSQQLMGIQMQGPSIIISWRLGFA